LETQKLCEDPVGTIFWLDDIASLYVVYDLKCYDDFAKYRNFLDIGLKLASQKKAKKWLADVSKLPGTPPGYQEYVQDEWRPRAFSAGLRYSAIILPQNTLGQLEFLKNVARLTELETQFFGSFEEARNWLFQKS
jgi:hypothetical protein